MMDRKDETTGERVEVSGSLKIRLDGHDFGEMPATYISINGTREQLIEQVKDFPEGERFDVCFYQRTY